MLYRSPEAVSICIFRVSVKVDGHSLGQHLSHQFVSLLSLHLQLLCPLPNQILQVGGVLFQHAQHRVDDVGLLSLGDALELTHEKEGTGMSYPAGYFCKEHIRTSRSGSTCVFSVFTCLKISSKVGLL